MNNSDNENNILESKWLKWFNKESSFDTTFDLYSTLKPSSINEQVEAIWNKLSNIYLIACSPFKIDDWKELKDIFDILKGYENKAEWRTLELLIWEYNKETMNDAYVKTEELKKQYKWEWIEIRDPKRYFYMIGYFWWTSWRTIQEVIKVFKQIFPDKIKNITPENFNNE